MIIKNIKHNIKNYMAYLIGNSIIQCILFMFFTLVFNPKFMENKEFLALKGELNTIVIFMIAFSAAFIIFTTVSFTKYRGREFGVYFTIGLTSKEIIKILCYENIIISLASFLIASLSGSIFSKLFHMAIGKILNIDNIVIPLSIKAYAAVLLISFVIFLFTTVYQMIFLNRYSVINILKSKSKKDIGSTSTILGVIGIIIFIGSFVIVKMIADRKINSRGSTFSLAPVVGTIVSVYLLIGFSMTVVVKVMKKFKKAYNNNILFINSLSHRFISYRIVLYVVTLMVSGGIVFISFAYSMYKSTEKQVGALFPYDMSFIVDKSSIKDMNIKDFITKNLGEVKSYDEVEGLNIPNIRVNDGACLWRRPNMLVISEDSYKALGNNELNLKKGEIFYCHAEKTGSFYDGGFMLDLSKKVMDDTAISLGEYKAQRNTDEYIYVPKEKKEEKVAAIVNISYNEDYFRGDFVVASNEDYKAMEQKLGHEAITYDVLIDLKEEGKYERLSNELEANFGKKVSDTLITREKTFDKAIKENSFMLFICSFMGMMFLVGSAAVIYFKTITSIEEDRERSKQLMKIGLSRKEINALIMKELGAVFLVPPIIALVCIGFYLSAVFNKINDGEYMLKNSLFVFGVYSVIQIIFYFLTSNRYKKQVIL